MTTTTTTYLVAQPPAQVTQQQVDNLLCAAFEGGITYWCGAINVQGTWPEGARWKSETLTRGATIMLHDAEDDEVYYLTLDNFLVGLQKACALRKKSVDGFYDDHDALDADIVVQFAVFGDVIYG